MRHDRAGIPDAGRTATRPVSAPIVVLLFLLALGGVTSVHAFAQAAPRPSFEVASIKRNTTPSDRNMLGQTGPGTFRAQNSTVRNLIRAAYDVKAFQVVGGPSWIDTDHYDVIAKPRVAAAPLQGDEWPEMALMLQSLLEDRFRVRLHRESRDLPIYVLVTVKGENKLHEPGKCVDASDAAAAASASSGQMFCGSSRLGRTGPSRSIDGATITMADFAGSLSIMTGREVIDRTGYVNPFDMHLEWAPDDGAIPSSPADPNSAPLSTAIQEQLGLRLESNRGPVTVLVIDSVDRPEPD